MDIRDFPNVMEQQVDLRPARPDDYPAMADLLRTLAQDYITPGMAAEVATTFLRDNDLEALLAYRAKGHVATVALMNGQLAGFIAIRPPSHLFHLFVDARWQRRGVARALWNAATAAHPASTWTVNSSPYAVPVYERLGFRVDGAVQCRNGVTFQPMVLQGSQARPAIA